MLNIRIESRTRFYSASPRLSL